MKLVRERVPDFTEVYLSGGYKEEEKEGAIILPKEVMISQLKILFQTNRISGLFNKPEALMSAREKLQSDMFNLTKKEILNYETNVQVNPIHWNPETRTGENDDLAIVLGLACWPLQ